MQIIIVQAEIETAIRNYILSQLSIREGMSINIDLQATRGAEGFKAIIDIASTPIALPVSAYVAPTAVAFMAINAVRTPQSPAEVRQLMADQYAKEDAADVVASVAAAIVEARSSVDESNAHPTVSTEASAEVTSEVVDAPVALKSPSLFKNLRKPVNA